MSVAEAFAGASGGILGSLTSIFTRNSNNKAIARENAAQRQFAHDEAALAHDRQLEIMDKQNEWNSFGNQRKLAEEAGFNPNMIFGQGGAAGIATSSGASGGAQANTPSVGYPDSVVDPSVVGALSDAALKAAQVKNINADTHKKESETAGQDLQNAFQEVSNSIYSEFGRLEKQLDLNQKDAQRAVLDAQRLLIRSEDQLNVDELYNMRPKQAAQLVADTLVSYANEYESRMRAAKTNEEREYISKNFNLQCYIAASTVALNYANARRANVDSDNWSQGGILYKGAKLSNDISTTNRNWLTFKNAKQQAFVNDVYRDFRDAVSSSLKSIGMYNATVYSWSQTFGVGKSNPLSAPPPVSSPLQGLFGN